MTNEAQKILELIENVSPDDTDTLDEIDARVWCWLKHDVFVGFLRTWNGRIIKGKLKEYDFPNKYTRSRDALKAIRPDGWHVNVKLHSKHFNNWSCLIDDMLNADIVQFLSERLPTEELAELHAIIQAIQWERENENTSN